MAISEREECKKLAAEAKSRTEQNPSEEYQYKVQGMPGYMRIVRLKVRN